MATAQNNDKVLMTLRVPRDLREAFEAACALEDRPQSRVLREFMRDYAGSSRIPREVKQAFEAACEVEERTPAAVLDELMRGYVRRVLEENDHD